MITLLHYFWVQSVVFLTRSNMALPGAAIISCCSRTESCFGSSFWEIFFFTVLCGLWVLSGNRSHQSRSPSPGAPDYWAPPPRYWSPAPVSTHQLHYICTLSTLPPHPVYRSLPQITPDPVCTYLSALLRSSCDTPSKTPLVPGSRSPSFLQETFPSVFS